MNKLDCVRLNGSQVRGKVNGKLTKLKTTVEVIISQYVTIGILYCCHTFTCHSMDASITIIRLHVLKFQVLLGLRVCMWMV